MAKRSVASMLEPGDYESQLASIERQRKIADAMTGNALNSSVRQGSMVSGHYIPPAWGDAVADVLGAYLGKKKSKELDEQTEDAKAQYQTGLGDAVKDYLRTKEGYSQSTPLTEVTADGSVGAPVQEQVAGDPTAAIVNAMTSQYKPLQALGQAEMSQMGKQRLSQKDILGLAGENKYDPNSVREAALTGDITKLRPAMKEHVVNGQLVRNGDNGPAVTFDGRDKFADPGQVAVGPDGRPIIGQKNLATNEAKFAAGGTTVNVDTGKKGADAFATTANEAAAKRLVESSEAAKKAQQSYEIFSNAKAMLPQSGSGTGAELVLGAKKLAQALGAPIDDSITSTEQVSAALGQAVLDNSKLLGSGNGFTDKDREFLQNIVLGKITLDAQTLRRAVDLGLAGSINTLRGHDYALSKARNIQGADPAVLEQFAVPVPHFSFDGKDFDYDPQSRRVTVKSGASGSRVPPAAKPAPTPSNSGLTPAEEKRLQELRAQFKGKF